MPKTRTILVVEADRRDIGLLKDAFARTRLEHRLQFVANGEEAAAYLFGAPPFDDRQAHPLPDLVLLDVTFSASNGFEVLELIKSTSLLRHIPVCIMSGYSSTPSRQRAAKLGAAWFHLKRAEPESWDKIVREMCDESPKDPAPSQQK
jgi:CheY-like chemotaxis protein